MENYTSRCADSEAGFLTAMGTVCTEHLGLRPGESLLLAADPPMRELAGQMTEAAVGLGFSARLLALGPIEKAGLAPPEFTVEALAAAEVALLVTSRSLSHTVQRRAACREKGLRIASMPGLTREMLLRLFIPGSPGETAEKTRSLASRLEGAGRVRVSGPGGTDFELDLTGRKIYADTGLYHSPGDFGNLPAGEVAAAPLPGTLQGVALVDVAFAGLGPLEPVTLELGQGRLKSARGPDARRVVEMLDKPELRVAGEFGIGTNPLARPCAVTLEAEKAVGTVHLGFGDNRSFGGENAADGHWDAVLFCGGLEVDGRRIDL